jgi:multidrug efflux pump subunit AcrA (membrane-fusion protein)
VQFDPAGKSSENVTREHQALSRSQGGHAVLSLPLRHKDEVVGVVTLEFLPNQQLGPHVASGLGVAVELLAPQLWDRYNNDRWLITKAGISTRDTLKLLMGPKHMLAKSIIFLVIVAVLVVFNIPYMIAPVSWLDCRPLYRVSAPFEFVPTASRSVDAPFDGELEKLATIDGKLVKPGTRVKAGDILAYMQKDELTLQLASALEKKYQAELTAKNYRNDDDPQNDPDAETADQDAVIADAEAKLIQFQLEQAVIRAPMDGVILTGDLEEKQGAKVERGKTLFEIGQLEQLKVEIRVNERDVQLIEVGRAGEVATRSQPDDKFPFTVERIVQMGEVKEGANTFRVYGTLHNVESGWLPRMVGEARIEVGKRSWGWIWTHRLVDWVRLQLWM